MAIQNSKTRIAAAVGAVMGAGLAAPAGAVVVVGGDNGWEVSFDGNVNAFYTVGDYDAGYTTETANKTASRVSSGFLPAFFSFNVKSPTIDGMTGSARISFAPVIHTGGPKTNFYANGGGNPSIQGSGLDTREVVANLSGAFGEVSFGRTLSLFGRNAILSDMTLFGVGFAPGGDSFGSVTFGRSGHGYTYPDFAARFQYTTPVVNGFQLAFGVYDPSTFNGLTSYNAGLGGVGSLLDENHTPRFEGEISYSTAFSGGNVKVWADGLWQDTESSCTGPITGGIGGIPAQCGDFSTSAWGAGAKVGYQGFEFVGYYHDNSGLGLTSQFSAAAAYVDAGGQLQERDGDGFYVQGTYTIATKTKVGVSYGEGNLDGLGVGDSALAGIASTKVERQLWTVGVYHDVSSWLRLIAEYNRGELNTHTPGKNPGANTFSVGSFLFW